MPKTKFQSVIFTSIMVFCMTCYTVALNMGEVNYSIFAVSIREMWVEYVVVFLLIFFIITAITRKLALRMTVPEGSQPFCLILAVQSFTVCLIVPIITLFATFFHNGFKENWFVQWIQTLVMCFPMAYCLQILFVGPLVRFIFRGIFRNQILLD